MHTTSSYYQQELTTLVVVVVHINSHSTRTYIMYVKSAIKSAPAELPPLIRSQQIATHSKFPQPPSFWSGFNTTQTFTDALILNT